MNSALPIYALGAIVLMAGFASKKSSTSTSTTSKFKPQGDIKSPDIKTPRPSVKIGDLKSPIKCDLSTEYYDVTAKKCIQFWKPGETDIQVEKKLNDLVDVLKNFDVTDFCKNPYEGNINPTAMSIIEKTVSSIWNISLDKLPPDENTPDWILTVWNNVVDIYYDKICNI